MTPEERVVSNKTSTTEWREELEDLRREMHLNSLGDRPHSMAAGKLARLCELESYERRLRLAQQSDPSTNGVMVDNDGGRFGHRDFRPATELQHDSHCMKHCDHDLQYMRGDPAHVAENRVWCMYEDEDGFCGHTCKPRDLSHKRR